MMKLNWEHIQENPMGAIRGMVDDEVAEVLKQASDSYYNSGNTLLPDEVYDMIRAELVRRNPSHPILGVIGAPVAASGAKKVKLPFWMGSLDKIRDDPKAVEKFGLKFPGSYIVSDKLDGNSAMLIQKNNKRFLYSRGDGYEGQDVSHLLPYLKNLPPMTNRTMNMNVTIRGELVISKENWDKIKHKGANARNMVAGAMHSVKNVDKEVADVIDFVAYELMDPQAASPEDSLRYMKQQCFQTVCWVRYKQDLLNIENLSIALVNRRSNASYEIDGLVVTHNYLHSLVSGKNPKYAFAIKSMVTHDVAEVTVKEVTWAISKDGYMKPLVHFEPVVLSGATIQKATGFHGRFIADNVIGPGSKLQIIRSGDVIPHIHSVLKAAVSGKAQLPPDPETWKWNSTKTDIVLLDTNADENAEFMMKRMTHFVSVLKVRGLAEKLIERIYHAGFKSIEAMWDMKEDDLLSLDGFKQTMAQKIYAEINAAKARATVIDYMVASNYFGRGFSHKRFELIFGSIPDILTLPETTLRKKVEGIDGIGKVIAKQFVEGLPKFKTFMDGLKVPYNNASTNNQPAEGARDGDGVGDGDNARDIEVFRGKKIVLSGFRDKEIERRIESAGGTVATSVSGKTDFVVVKSEGSDSSKAKKAKELGVTIITLQDLLNKLS